MNWEVILWTCITVGVLLAICGIIMMVISARNMKKRRKEIGEVHTTLRVGNRILFAGGLYGRVVKIYNDETIDVEISKDFIVKASRYSIQNIESKYK